MAFFKKKREEGGQKTGFGKKIKSFFTRSDIGPDFWDELEELLLTSDVGLPVVRKIIDSSSHLKKIDEVKSNLSKVMSGLLKSHDIELREKPHVIMVVGVNGTGKTTTIAKLANKFKDEGKKVLLVAADTFRAAAIEQLKIWGERLELPVVAQKPDSDPAAVSYDGIQSAISKEYDVVILDTAGRLHTKKNLMDELLKVGRVSGKALDGAPHDTLLVLDATIGQNGLAQAQTFHEVLGLTGVIITKMDGTAKGGVIFSITEELGLPVSFIGIGEQMTDLKEFHPEPFVAEIIE
jgi:fused signal recognition particle receptor